MKEQITEIPIITIPDEVTHTNRPEIIETTPHPQVPDPQVAEPAAQGTEQTAEVEPIGFETRS